MADGVAAYGGKSWPTNFTYYVIKNNKDD